LSRPYGPRWVSVNAGLDRPVDDCGEGVGTVRGVAVDESVIGLWTTLVGTAPRRGDLQRRPAPAVHSDNLAISGGLRSAP
jgi:hypothetical protein